MLHRSFSLNCASRVWQWIDVVLLFDQQKMVKCLHVNEGENVWAFVSCTTLTIAQNHRGWIITTEALLLPFLFLDQVHTSTLYVRKAGSYLRHVKIYHLLGIRQFFSPPVHGSCFGCILIAVKFSAYVLWLQLFQLQISSLVSDASIGSPLREEQTRSQSAFFSLSSCPSTVLGLLLGLPGADR